MVRAAMKIEEPTGTATSHVIRLLEMVHGASPSCGRHQFLEVTSLSIWMSRACSATKRLRRRFSSSICLRRLASLTSMPPYLVFPPVVGALGDAVPADQIADLGACLSLFEDGDDLFLGGLLPLHETSSWPTR